MNSIKELRTKLNMTQIEMAECLGVRQSTVAMWESGKNMPRADMLLKIARLLGCSIDDLFAA